MRTVVPHHWDETYWFGALWTGYGLTAIGFSRYTSWDESKTILFRSQGGDLGEEWIHDY